MQSNEAASIPLFMTVQVALATFFNGSVITLVVHKSVLKGVASALGVSYTSLANDLEATSYSSIRQGALEERDQYANTQRFMVDHFIRPIFDAWLEAAMEMDSFGIPVRQFDKFSNAAEFRGRSWSWVDPQKEMTAAIGGMQAGILSLQDVAGQYGKDTEELLGQIQRDRALMEQFGVSYALEPYGVQKMPVIPEGEEITCYSQGEFIDLCRGPHVDNTRALPMSFKLLHVAGAYCEVMRQDKCFKEFTPFVLMIKNS